MALADILGGIERAARAGADIAVMPECSFPGYVLLDAKPDAIGRASDRAARRIADAARRSGIAVCVGLARLHGRRLQNEAVYFDRRGDEVARYAKMFLWNFDSRWFSAGSELPVFDTEFGRLGMMICADGRMPEIARTLARRGAWLVLDPTAWVSVGRDAASMRNPQVDFVMRTRARENGIWIAAADKCGSEHEAVHYVGASMVVAPDGRIVARASAESPAIVVARLTRTGPRPITVPVTARERALLRGQAHRRGRSRGKRARLGVLQGPDSAHRSVALAALEAQGVDAIIETAWSAGRMRREARRIVAIRIVVLAGRAMLAPEPARAAALDAADAIAWFDPPSGADARGFARTRALENRVFVVVCVSTGAAEPACVIDPSGAVVGEALAGKPSGFAIDIDLSSARDKLVVPGTDAFAARVPRAFALFDGGAR